MEPKPSKTKGLILFVFYIIDYYPLACNWVKRPVFLDSTISQEEFCSVFLLINTEWTRWDVIKFTDDTNLRVFPVQRRTRLMYRRI